jgi:hypothetical protein
MSVFRLRITVDIDKMFDAQGIKHAPGTEILLVQTADGLLLEFDAIENGEKSKAILEVDPVTDGEEYLWAIRRPGGEPYPIEVLAAGV